MIIDPNSMANRYQIAERLVWQKLADWRKQAIENDRKTGNLDSHFLSDFAKEVIQMAESESFLETPKATPKKPVVTKIKVT